MIDRYIIMACFFLSGLSALIFQTAWMKLISFVFGTSHLAVATVLAAYMFGLAVGAFIAPKMMTKFGRPIVLYAVLEVIIAIGSLLVPFLIDCSQDLYVQLFGGQDFPSSPKGVTQPLFFLISTFLIISLPTIAMGATLPILTKHIVRSNSTIGTSTGTLYFLNTIGATAGVIICGFALLPYLGVLTAGYIAATINIFIFLTIFFVFKRSKTNEGSTLNPLPFKSSGCFSFSYVFSMLCGVVSFSLEVYWTRLLSHVLGSTSYAFAIMLASFLSGIAFGSLVGGRLARTQKNAIRVFFLIPLFAALCTFLAYLLVVNLSLPKDLTLVSKIGFSFLILFPSTFFIGMTFPILVRAITMRFEHASSIAARLYFWNTLGAIVGSLSTGFYLLPLLGFDTCIKFLVFSLLGISIAALVKFNKPNSFSLCSITLVSLFCLLSIPSNKVYSVLHAHVKSDGLEVKSQFFGVGKSSTILLHEQHGYFWLASNGLSESAIGSKGMPPYNLSQQWLTGLPSVARPHAKDYAIIGLGGGIAINGVPPHATTIDVFELEPLVIEANMSVSTKRYKDPLADKRVNLVVNDARNALELTEKTYDVIVSQPSHPWTGGASHLYTSEFLNLAKQKLKKDGVFLQWINSQFIDKRLFEVLIATISKEFKYIELYQPERQVLMFLASDAPIDIWKGQRHGLNALKSEPEHYATLGALNLEDLATMSFLENDALREISTNAPINTDTENMLAYFSRPRSDGLTSNDLISHYGHLDPLLFDETLKVFSSGTGMSIAYITEKLIQLNLIKRAENLAKSVNTNYEKLLIDAIGLEYSGNIVKARHYLNRAIKEGKGPKDAEVALLRNHLNDFAKLSITSDIASLANRQSGPERAVLEGWVLGAQGRVQEIERLDKTLSLLSTNSLFYPIALKLRIDWRLWKSSKTKNKVFAQKALDLIDSILASYWNIDLYMLRFFISKELKLSFHQFESLSSAIQQLNAMNKQNRSSKGSRITTKKIIGFLKDLKNDPALSDYSERIEFQIDRLNKLLK